MNGVVQLGTTGLAISVRGAQPRDTLSWFQHCVSSHLALDMSGTLAGCSICPKQQHALAHTLVLLMMLTNPVPWR